MLKYFKENQVVNNKIDETKLEVKRFFDETYPFPYDSYKYVFYFLDIIHDLKDGNAYNTFESFADIKESLKKQWAGFMYESLTKKESKEKSIIEPLEEKISHIDNNLKKLLEIKSVSDNSQISFDISKISREINIDSLEELQNRIQGILNDIFSYPVDNYKNGISEFRTRAWFNKKATIEETTKWIEFLGDLVKDYKWSKYLNIHDVFVEVNCFKWLKNKKEISYKSIFELYSIYESLTKKDKVPFIKTIQRRFIDSYEDPRPDSSDGLPF